MDETTAYVFWVLLIILIFVVIRVLCTVTCRKLADPPPPPTRRRVIQRIRIDPPGSAAANIDRQGNIFTISDDASMNAGANHYADFFYLEPSADDAARIRAQLEKDEKDLPSYEDVMGMNNLAAPTAGIGPGVSTTSIATNTTTVSSDLPPEVPPYSEVDPRSVMSTTDPAPAATSTGAAPSTSRAASAAASSTTVTIVPIMNSTSATIV